MNEKEMSAEETENLRSQYEEQIAEDEFHHGTSRIYSDLCTDVFKCTRCDLGCEKLLDGHDPHVMGQGNPKSRVMFVAEAPGLQETINKQPLTSTGTSGKLYEKVLKALGYEFRDDVYTTNIILCRPPKNRDPEPWEILKCKGFLQRQIQMVEPKLIVTFGRLAAQVFLGSFKITKEHGKLRDSEQYKVKVFPLYHPAYVQAYSKNKMAEFKEDVKKLKEILVEMELA